MILLKKSFIVAWPFYCALFFIFIVTFTIFPGTTNDTYIYFMRCATEFPEWNFLFLITLFNVFDTVGRFLAPRF